jgi:hypothetical protein
MLELQVNKKFEYSVSMVHPNLSALLRKIAISINAK